MSNVIFESAPHNKGAFIIKDDQKVIADMQVGITGSNLVAYHTGVVPEAEGKGLAKELLNTMVAYAREHHLQVIPQCVYVQGQFKRHPELYADVWKG